MTKNALEMINDLDDEFVLSAMEEPKAKIRPFKKLRWTAAAACMAVLLAVPAVAQAMGLTLEFDSEVNAWKAETDGRFAEDEYSAEIRGITGQKMFIHESIDEAEKFIGIDFPKNAVLEEAEKCYVYTDFAEGVGEDGEIHCNSHVVGNEGHLMGTHTMAYFIVDKSTVEIIYSTVCEENPNENGGGFGVSFENEAASESYVNPNGREFKMVIEKDDYGNNSIYAFTDCDGILVTVSVNIHGEARAREILYKVLDAYK